MQFSLTGPRVCRAAVDLSGCDGGPSAVCGARVSIEGAIISQAVFCVCPVGALFSFLTLLFGGLREFLPCIPAYLKVLLPQNPMLRDP